MLVLLRPAERGGGVVGVADSLFRRGSAVYGSAVLEAVLDSAAKIGQLPLSHQHLYFAASTSAYCQATASYFDLRNFIIVKVGMETKKGTQTSEMKEKVFQMFSEFMLWTAKVEEHGAVGSKLFVGFLQALEFLRCISIDKKSELVESIIKMDKTKELASCVKAVFVHTPDKVQNIIKLHTCHVELFDHLQRAKCLLNELECIMKNVTQEIQNTSRSLAPMLDVGDESTFSEEEPLSSNRQTLKVVDYAAMMAVLYGMVKQDFLMQKKIVSSLSLKSSSEELESYNLMWSLRPFITDDIVHQAWKLIP